MNPTETDKNSAPTAPAEEAAKTPENAANTAPAETAALATSLEKADAPAQDAAADGTKATEAADEADEEVGTDEADETDETDAPRESSGLLSAAAGVVAAGLGVVGLSGGWVGRVAAERQTLLGQLETAQGAGPAEQISAIYGDAWHTTALVNGVFAFVALVVGVAVLSRPRKPGWVRACALGGAVLGGIGVLAAAGMYFDLLLPLPQAGS